MSAQRVAVGVKAGVVLNDTFSGGFRQLSDESKHYTIGPSVELRFSQAFALEFDALYRHVGYDGDSSFLFQQYTRERDTSWEFPILGKYRLLPTGRVHPFLVGGYAARVISGSATDVILSTPLPSFAAPTTAPYRTKYNGLHGFVGGGGFEFGVGRLRFGPELRYTRWNQHFLDLFALSAGRSTTQNQVQILVGISWNNQN